MKLSPILIRVAPLLLLAPLLYWFWWGGGSDFLQNSVRPSLQSGALAGKLAAGKPAPLFTIPKERNLNGQEFALSNTKAKLVLLHFWATWCGPCVEELPELIELVKQRKDLQVIAISLDRDWQTLGDFFTRYPRLKELEKIATLLLDPAAKIPSLYGTMGLPESFLLRSNLTLDTKLVGPQPWLSAPMRALLDRVSQQTQ